MAANFEGPAIVYIATDGVEYALDIIEDGLLTPREEAIARALMLFVLERTDRPKLATARAHTYHEGNN